MSDCNNVFTSLQNDRMSTSVLQQCIDEYEAVQQKERLTHTLDAMSTTHNTRKRKM